MRRTDRVTEIQNTLRGSCQVLLTEVEANEAVWLGPRPGRPRPKPPSMPATPAIRNRVPEGRLRTKTRPGDRR